MSKAQKIKQFFSGTPSKSDERKIIMPLAKAINASLDDKGYERFRDKMLEIINEGAMYRAYIVKYNDDVKCLKFSLKKRDEYYEKEFFYGGPSNESMYELTVIALLIEIAKLRKQK